MVHDAQLGAGLELFGAPGVVEFVAVDIGVAEVGALGEGGVGEECELVGEDEEGQAEAGAGGPGGLAGVAVGVVQAGAGEQAPAVPGEEVLEDEAGAVHLGFVGADAGGHGGRGEIGVVEGLPAGGAHGGFAGGFPAEPVGAAGELMDDGTGFEGPGQTGEGGEIFVQMLAVGIGEARGAGGKDLVIVLGWSCRQRRRDWG